MKKILYIFLLILVTISAGCLRVTDYETLQSAGPLVDSTLSTTSFTSGAYTPGSGAFDFCVAKSPSTIQIFYVAGSRIYALSVNGTSFGTEVTVRNNFYTTSTVDAAYDADYARFRIVHSYDVGSWPPNGLVMCTSWNGASPNTFDVDDMAADQVAIVQAGDNFYQFSNYQSAGRLYNKTITFTGTTSQTVTPAFTIGAITSLLFEDYSSSFEDVTELRTAYNPNTGDAMFGYSKNGGGYNEFHIIQNDGDFYGGAPYYKDNGSNANNFSVSAIGNYFVMAYESNLDIAQQNINSYSLTGEHIRLGLMDGNAAQLDPIYGAVNSADYVSSEKSLALPLPINSSNTVTGIALASNNDASEVGLSFVRDNNLYFSKLVLQSGKLKMAPLSTVATGLPPTIKMRSIFFGGKYYILILNLGTFTVHESL